MFETQGEGKLLQDEGGGFLGFHIAPGTAGDHARLNDSVCAYYS
jgi:hypothetical protein